MFRRPLQLLANWLLSWAISYGLVSLLTGHVPIVVKLYYFNVRDGSHLEVIVPVLAVGALSLIHTLLAKLFRMRSSRKSAIVENTIHVVFSVGMTAFLTFVLLALAGLFVIVPAG